MNNSYSPNVPPIYSRVSHLPLSELTLPHQIHLSILGSDGDSGATGKYTTNTSNQKRLISQDAEYSDTPTFQPVIDVLSESAPTTPAAVTAPVFEGRAEYRGFYIHAWLIEGYGCVGEVRDAGNNIMPRWMNTDKPVEFISDAVDFMIARVDEYLAAVTASDADELRFFRNAFPNAARNWQMAKERGEAVQS